MGQLWTLISSLLGGTGPFVERAQGSTPLYLRGAAVLQGGLPIEADLQEGGTKAPFVSSSA